MSEKKINGIIDDEAESVSSDSFTATSSEEMQEKSKTHVSKTWKQQKPYVFTNVRCTLFDMLHMSIVNPACGLLDPTCSYAMHIFFKCIFFFNLTCTYFWYCCFCFQLYEERSSDEETTSSIHDFINDEPITTSSWTSEASDGACMPTKPLKRVSNNLSPFVFVSHSLYCTNSSSFLFQRYALRSSSSSDECVKKVACRRALFLEYSSVSILKC